VRSVGLDSFVTATQPEATLKTLLLIEEKSVQRDHIAETEVTHRTCAHAELSILKSVEKASKRAHHAPEIPTTMPPGNLPVRPVVAAQYLGMMVWHANARVLAESSILLMLPAVAKLDLRYTTR
jgi:hypothetical protein